MKLGAAAQHCRGSPTRRAEPIAKPADQGSARPVSCFPPICSPGEKSMYATIRRYTVRDATKAHDAISSLKGRIEEKFVPMIQDLQGFHCYYVLSADDRELVTISIFESADGA